MAPCPPTSDLRERRSIPDRGQKRTLGHLPALDGLRAVAIMAVLLGHSSGQLFGPFGVYENESWVNFSSHGRLGVDLFFAISGFLITHRLMAEFLANGSVSLRAFYVRRVFRILPPYVAYLCVIVGLALIGILRVHAWEITSSCLFLRNYFMTWTTGGESTNHFWSLSVEEHFYLLWPLSLLLLGLRRALWVTPLLALLIHGWTAFDTRHQLFARLLPDAGALFRSDTRMDALLWGCFGALVYPRLQRHLNFGRWRGGLCQAAAPVLLVMVIVFHFPMMHLWLAVLFPLMVVCCVAQPDTVAGRFLDRPALSWLGRMSYSLYIWQTLFLQCEGTSQSLSHHVGGLPKLFYWMVDLASILLVAALSYYGIEKTMIALGRGLAKGRTIRPTTESGPGNEQENSKPGLQI